jgi:hypothetical protein
MDALHLPALSPDAAGVLAVFDGRDGEGVMEWSYSVPEKAAELTTWSGCNQAPAGKVLIMPSAVAALEEVKAARGSDRSRVHLLDGTKLDLYEDYAVAKERLGL